MPEVYNLASDTVRETIVFKPDDSRDSPLLPEWLMETVTSKWISINWLLTGHGLGVSVSADENKDIGYIL